MYKALKSFNHDQLGRIEKGQEFEATPAQIGGVKQFVEEYQTKVVGNAPETKEKKSPKRRTKKAD